MPSGSFDDFRDALRAFESGWDRARYDAGTIADWQLDSWAGGPVQTFYPNYQSWSELSAGEWETMSYRSMNSLGFVGYQFGEALLIDLGYYDDDLFYGNGAASNTWDGTWTGKNGATSLDAFMTKDVQEKAILDAFGHNLQIIENGLSHSGQDLSDFIGTTRSYVENGQTTTVDLSLTGILAASHLRGAYGTINLLLGGNVSTDEFGTSILQYVEQFGGYNSPSITQLIADWENGKTGDEGLGGNPGNGDGDSGDPDNGGNDNPDGGSNGGNDGMAGVDANSADVIITWSWGQDVQITDFNPASSTVFVDWISADFLEVSESNGNTVIAVPSNNQSTTLVGVTLAELSPANFTFLDASAAQEVLALIGQGDSGGGDNGGGDDGGDNGQGDDGHDHGDGSPMMVMIGPDTASQTIPMFDTTQDMIHIEAGITADRFEIFEESGDALGQTVRIAITDANGATISTTIIQGIGLSDLSFANFSIADQSVQNEVAAAIGSIISNPGNSNGYDITYDNDGSAPPQITGTTSQGGNKYRADVNADDIVGFNAASDELDFGGTSVHGMILTKTPAGEIAIDSPWSNAVQIVQNVGYQDTTIGNYGVVGNEHLRQDLGGVVSWELGIGPRDSDTVYIRSHEYGQSEVISNFDPSSMKISFLYFGTRERLSVEDSNDGLVISSLPTGQSFTFTGLQLADLSPGQVEFHFDQVMEDNLEVPFGFNQEDVTLVDRTVLLTPTAPSGQSTDGFQTRDGVWNQDGDGGNNGGGDTGGGDTGGGDNGGGDTGGGDTGGGDNGGGDTGGGDNGDGDNGGSPQTVAITWAWARDEVISDFNTSEDVIDFGNVSSNQLGVSTANDGDLIIEILNNGGQTYEFDNVQPQDLSASNFTANDWNMATVNAVLNDIDQLI